MILNLQFTYNGIFPSEYFQDQPNVTLSFETEQHCIDVQYCIRYRLEVYVATRSPQRKIGKSSFVYNYRLFQAKYATLKVSRSNSSKTFTVLVFRTLSNSILIQRATVLYSLSQQLNFYSSLCFADSDKRNEGVIFHKTQRNIEEHNNTQAIVRF